MYFKKTFFFFSRTYDAYETYNKNMSIVNLDKFFFFFFKEKKRKFLLFSVRIKKLSIIKLNVLQQSSIKLNHFCIHNICI
jgi:hypothetical protein